MLSPSMARKAAERIEELEASLEMAINVIEWWIKHYPERVCANDYDQLDEFKSLLNQN